MFGALFCDSYETIEEGPVEIQFVQSKNNKVKFIITVDFGETDLPPEKASDVFKSIVADLRLGLGVSLSKCR